jgi:hypothetical protein
MPEVQIPANFRQWAERLSAPHGVTLDWPLSSNRQCVITVATGYPANLLKPLVHSLREHSDAHLVIAANEGSGLEEAFAGHDVTVYPVRPSAGYRPYPALARIEYYLDILGNLPAGVDQLLLVDSRDVIFQADPFAQLPGNDLTFFAENNDTGSWTLKTTNGRWAWAMLPSDMRRQLIGKPIANGGVIAGTRSGIERMCRAKLDIASKTGEWTKHTTGLDNISTNVISHAGLAGDSELVANYQIVCNIYRDADMMIDDAGLIVRRGRKPCPIVHMYDRQPALLAHVNAKFGVQTDQELVLNQVRSLDKASMFNDLSHWLKLVRIYLTAALEIIRSR